MNTPISKCTICLAKTKKHQDFLLVMIGDSTRFLIFFLFYCDLQIHKKWIII